MKKACFIAGVLLSMNFGCGILVYGEQELNKEIKNGKMPESLPLITVSPSGKPIIDGKLDDECWQNSVEIPTLPNRIGDKLTEATLFFITYDKENLYIGAEVQQSYLDPVYNLLDKIKPSASKRDGPVSCDDSIEVFLMPGDFYYQLVVNLDGTVYDAKGTGPEWNSSLKAVTAKKEKSWTVEIAIPFSDLGVKDPEGQTWRANFYRNNPAKKESGAWSPTEKSFHTIAAFGRVNFSSPAPVIRCKNISLKSGSAEIGLSAITREALKIPGSSDELLITPGTNQNVNVRLKPDNAGNGQLAVLAGKKEIFRTPLLAIKSKMSVKTTTSEMLAEIACPGNTIEVFINGKSVASGRDSVRAPLLMEADQSVVALKISGEAASIPAGKFTIAGISFSLDAWLCLDREESSWNSVSFDDSKWDLYKGGKIQASLFFRHTLIKNHTLFAPQLKKNTLYVANKAPMCAAIRIGSPFEKPLADYTCHLILPEGLNIPVYDPENREWYKYKHKLSKNRKNGTNEYTFNFEKPVPKLEYNFGFNAIILIISPEFPEEQEKKTLKGVCYISGRGMHEVPGEFDIAILPFLKGIQPENIGIGTWIPMRELRNSNAETESMFKTFKSMGLNRLVIDFRAGSNSLKCATAYQNIKDVVKKAKENNLKTLLSYSGNHGSSFFADILVQHPEYQFVNNTNKRPAWQKPICPEAYMSAPEIKKRIEDLSMIFNRIVYDIEAGIKSSCLCEKCRDNFAGEFKLDKTPSEQEVYEKYKDELTRYQVNINFRGFNFMRATAKKANPNIKCDVYSGYADNPHEVYGMDWTLYKDIVDMPSAGYSGFPSILKTRELIGNHPLCAGLMLYSKLYEYQYSDQNIKAALFSQMILGGFGGVHIWTWEELNGVGLTAVAEFARGVAAYESFLKEQYEIPNDGFITGTADKNIHVYKKGDEYLYIVLNPSPEAKEITVKTPPSIPDAEVYDFYADRRYEQSEEYKIQAPACDAVLLHIRKPGIFDFLFLPKKRK